MAPFTHVLAPIDLGERSRHTAFHADEIARSCRAELTLLHVHCGVSAEGTVEAERAAVLCALGDLADGLRRPRRPTLALESGDPATEILAYAVTHEVDLVVVGSHRRGTVEQMFVESVAETVAAAAPCSVLTVPEAADEARRPPADPSEIVCAVDLSDKSSDTLALALAVAKATRSHVTLLHVLADSSAQALRSAYQHLFDLLARISADHGNVDTLVTNGHPVAEIARIAETQRASLVVVGAGAPRAGGHAVRHRVGERLVRVAPCPLLLARPLAAKQACGLSAPRQEALVE